MPPPVVMDRTLRPYLTQLRANIIYAWRAESTNRAMARQAFPVRQTRQGGPGTVGSYRLVRKAHPASSTFRSSALTVPDTLAQSRRKPPVFL